VLLKCKGCGIDNAFKVEEMFNKNGLLDGVSIICSKCGEVSILPVKKEHEFRLKIRTKQDNKCFTCGKENPRTIHHRDSDSDNNSEDNLVLLCGKCHRKINRVKDIISSAKPELAREIILTLKTIKRTCLEESISQPKL